MKAYKRSHLPIGTIISPNSSWGSALWPLPEHTGRPIGRLETERVNVVLQTLWIEEKGHRWFLVMNHKGEVGWIFPTNVRIPAPG
jgi:hypothetical protein